MCKTSGRTLDRVAGIYDLLSPLMTFGQEKRLSRECLGLLELKGGEKVLDVGCGTGTLTIETARRLAGTPGSLVVGMDAAPKMLAVARRKSAGLGNVRFDEGIAEELPYGDESFDCIVSTFFFHHIGFGLKKKALGEMRRVLREKGKIVIVDVDVPVSFFGSCCAWAGYFLFQQEEIRENIEGKLREALDLSGFTGWRRVSTHQGYISVFTALR